MARLEARISDEMKEKLTFIAKEEKRTLTKELEDLIEERYKKVMKSLK